jgi:cbb3-type cytochrome oxidase cytochrome c subunit
MVPVPKMLAHSHPHSHGENRIDNHQAASGEPFGKNHAHKHNPKDPHEHVPDKIPPDFEHVHEHGHSDVDVVTDADTNTPVHRVLAGKDKVTDASEEVTPEHIAPDTSLRPPLDPGQKESAEQRRTRISRGQ